MQTSPARMLPNWRTVLLSGVDFMDYSDRVVTPEETVAAMWPHLPSLGITRVARQTDLDRIGLPVWAAFRPNSRSLSGSQGKGLTDAAACASAIMEAAEVAVAERPQTMKIISSAEDLTARRQRWYDPGRLLKDDATHGTSIRMTWLPGRDLHTSERIWVPLDAVDMDGERSRLKGICKTSNGLASGNTIEEAIFHGLCELIERDGTALASLLPLDAALATCFAASDLGDPAVDALGVTIEAAGFRINLFDQTSDLGVPVIMAVLAPIQSGPLRYLDISAGWGSHPVPARAAIRAITEAAQSRVTSIASSRDDISEQAFETEANDELVAQVTAQPRASAPIGLRRGTSLAELNSNLLTALAARGCHVTVVDISPPGLPFAVAKVLSADLEDRDANTNWRPGWRATEILVAA